MTQFFIGLYDYFERHKILFYLSLISCVLLMGFFALQVRFEENITQFFPDTKDSQNTIKVFDNLKIKDKIIIMLSSADTCHQVEPDSLIEAAGFDKIFVETVGVGQSETAVHSMVDFFLLIQLSGTGDELQGIKRGIMEMADGIVINKADGDNLERAKLAATQFRNALHLFPAPESGWIPKVLTYSGFYNLGVKEVWDMIYEYIDFVKENGYFEYRRNEQSKYWMYESINEQLRDSFYHNPKIEAMLLEKEQQVLKGNLTSFIAARSLLDTYFEDLK